MKAVTLLPTSESRHVHKQDTLRTLGTFTQPPPGTDGPRQLTKPLLTLGWFFQTMARVVLSRL